MFGRGKALFAALPRAEFHHSKSPQTLLYGAYPISYGGVFPGIFAQPLDDFLKAENIKMIKCQLSLGHCYDIKLTCIHPR